MLIDKADAETNPDAGAGMTVASTAGTDHELQSDHDIVAYYVVGEEVSGDDIYDDPFGYSTYKRPAEDTRGRKISFLKVGMRST